LSDVRKHEPPVIHFVQWHTNGVELRGPNLPIVVDSLLEEIISKDKENGEA
jgi:hypothetical protein